MNNSVACIGGHTGVRLGVSNTGMPPQVFSFLHFYLRLCLKGRKQGQKPNSSTPGKMTMGNMGKRWRNAPVTLVG